MRRARRWCDNRDSRDSNTGAKIKMYDSKDNNQRMWYFVVKPSKGVNSKSNIDAVQAECYNKLSSMRGCVDKKIKTTRRELEDLIKDVAIERRYAIKKDGTPDYAEIFNDLYASWRLDVSLNPAYAARTGTTTEQKPKIPPEVIDEMNAIANDIMAATFVRFAKRMLAMAENKNNGNHEVGPVIQDGSSSTSR